MHPRALGLVALVALAAIQPACRVSAQRTTAPTMSAQDSTLRLELLRRVEQDQAIRRQWTAMLQAGQQPDSTVLMRMMADDTANTEWLRALLADGRWPGPSRVGRDGAEALFTLVQHADSALQTSVLPLVERAYAAGELSGQNLALLTDRVARKNGRLQVYGTQADIADGRVTLAPIADSASVDQRRARLGLMPLAEYVRLMESMYTKQRP